MARTKKPKIYNVGGLAGSAGWGYRQTEGTESEVAITYSFTDPDEDDRVVVVAMTTEQAERAIRALTTMVQHVQHVAGLPKESINK